jgi:hypothetical protein
MAKNTIAKMKVEIPRTPNELLSLAETIYQKHLTDAANSPLKIIQDYDWNVVGATVATALQAHKNAEQLWKDSERYYKERDLLILNLTQIVKDSRDVLTGVYPTNLKKLGDWGYTVDDSPKVGAKKVSTKMRIDVPKNTGDLLNLANNIYQKHLADGANSPLNLIQGSNWTVEGPNITNALFSHQQAETSRANAELNYQQRNNLLIDITAIVKASRDLLTGMYRKNMKMLINWGFKVGYAAARKPKSAANNTIVS